MATTVSQPGYFNLQALTDLGALAVGGRIYTYSSGTTTKKNAYTEATGTTVHTYTSDGVGGEYIALNARGELPAPLYLTSGAYDITYKTAAGATVWTRVADTAGGTFLQSGTGASARTVQAKLRETVSVKDFGAVWDGSTDDVVAVNAAITAVNAAGGGVVQLPPGTGIVGLTGSSIAVSLLSNVTLQGAGPGATILKLKASADAHLINIADGVSNVAVKDLTLDGTRASQTASVHCLRVAGVDGLTVQNVEVQEAYQYGIGIQDGTNKNVKFVNVDIHDTGGDGIDFKNKNDDNEDVMLENITVRQWGLSGALTVQAGIDLRGPVKLSNIWVSEPSAADAVGIRFRQGELLDVNGLGAHKSSLANFHVVMGAGATQLGINVVARDVMLVNGYVSAGLRGISVQDSGFRASGITIEDCSQDGVLLDAGGSGLDADDAVLIGVQVQNCGADGFDVEADDVQLIACYAFTNNQGIRIQAAADGTQVIGGRYEGNTAGQIGDLGTNTRLMGPVGFTTSEYLSQSFRVAGGGTDPDRVYVDAASGSALIGAEGTTADIDILVVGKGSKGVRLRDGNGNDKVHVNTTGVGFHAATPLAKPTITGSRGGNAALASLLTQLANYGLITDGTSA